MSPTLYLKSCGRSGLASMSLAAMAAFTAILTPHADASVSITGMSQFNASTSDYTYSYSIQNLSATEEIALLTVAVSATGNVISLGAPVGYALTYDSFVNVINFAEDNDVATPQSFAPLTTVSGFSFRSPVAPGLSPYSAFDSAGAEFTGTVVGPVPEPTALGLALSGVAFMARRRRA